jgi:cyclin-dependent kinase 7
MVKIRAKDFISVSVETSKRICGTRVIKYLVLRQSFRRPFFHHGTMAVLYPTMAASASAPSAGSLLSNSQHWLECFGGDQIVEPVGGKNARVARGAFGEISIALHRCPCSPCSTDRSTSDTTCTGTCNTNYNKIDCRLQLAAVKTIMATSAIATPTLTTKLDTQVFHELCALQYLKGHTHIVQLLAVYPSRVDATLLSLAFSYAPTDMHLTLEWRRRSFLPLLSISVIKRLAKDMFLALHHCHLRGVLHGDVKTANWLVSSAGVVQLCDFGLAQPCANATTTNHPTQQSQTRNNNNRSAQQRGLCTLYYRPPELLLGAPAQHTSLDVWSVGMVLVELLLGRPLFAGNSVLGQLALIFDALGTPTNENWPNVSQTTPDFEKLAFAVVPCKSIVEHVPRALESAHLVDLIGMLIALDPSQRCTSADALDCSWLKTGLATRIRVAQETVPPELDEPILLSSNSLQVASEQALAVATQRREFLSKVNANACRLQDSALLHDCCITSLNSTV